MGSQAEAALVWCTSPEGAEAAKCITCYGIKQRGSERCQLVTPAGLARQVAPTCSELETAWVAHRAQAGAAFHHAFPAAVAQQDVLLLHVAVHGLLLQHVAAHGVPPAAAEVGAASAAVPAALLVHPVPALLQPLAAAFDVPAAHAEHQLQPHCRRQPRYLGLRAVGW